MNGIIIVFLILIALLCSFSYSQVVNDVDFLGNPIVLEDETGFGVASRDGQVQKLVDEILVSNNVSLEIKVRKDDGTYYAKAIIDPDDNSTPIVVYNPRDLEAILEGELDWLGWFVLAHEIGHHINANPLKQRLETVEKELEEERNKKNNRNLSSSQKSGVDRGFRHMAELNADQFAGGYLYEKGASDSDILAIFLENDIFHESDYHPDGAKRQKAVMEGWMVKHNSYLKLREGQINISNESDTKLYIIDDYNDEHRYPDKKYTRCEKKQFDADSGYIFTSAERIEVDDIAVNNMRGPYIRENGKVIEFSYCISASSTQAVNGRYSGSLYVEIEATQQLE